MATFGPRITTASGVRDEVDRAQLNQRGVAGAVFGPFAEPTWVTAIGMWTGRAAAGVNAQLTYAVWNEQNDGTPGERRGRTSAVAVTALFTGNNGGTNIQAGVTSTDRSFAPTNDAMLLMPGEQYVVGFRAALADVAYAVIPGQTARQYRRTVSSGDPTDPFDAAGSAVLGTPAIYLVGTVNTAPDPPTLTAPGNGAALNVTLMAFTGNFNDDDAVDFGDVMRAYRLELREVGTETLLWQAEYTADSAEKSTGAFNRLYEGSTLVGGKSYEWRAATADFSGTYSDWTAWRPFSINAIGAVSTDDVVQPVAKEESPSGITYDARWSHPSNLSANRVQVRILVNGTVIKTGPEVTKTVGSTASPGTLFNIGAVEGGVGPLAWGVDYEYQVRARASNNLWSPYSARRAFGVNAIPTVPANLQPLSGTSSTTRPLLQLETSDADDDESTGLTVELRIKNASGSVLGTFTPVRNPDTDVWEHQTTNAVNQLASFGTYRFDARSFDGSVYSGYSAEHVFSYVDGPIVNFVLPSEGQVLATSTPTISWTVANQTKYRLLIYREGTSRLVYDSREQVTAQNSHTVRAGYLKDGGNYDVVVAITNVSNQVGNSVRQSFSVVYAPPAALTGLQVSEAFGEFDPSDAPSGVLLSWDQSELSPGSFGGYVVTRRETGDDADDALVLRTIRNVGQHRWVDWGPASNTQYTYAVGQIQRVGADTVQSAAVEDDAIVVFRTVVVASATRPAQRRAVLRWDTSRSLDYRDDRSQYQTWGATAPTILDGPVAYEEFAGDFLIARFLNDPVDPRAVFLALEGLFRGNEIVLVRDERGTRVFGKITAFAVNFRRAGHYGVRLRVTEHNFTEGQNAP